MSNLVGNPEDRFSHNEARIFTTDIPCGSSITDLSGLIKFPDFNQDGLYDNFMKCRWVIEAIEGQLINFEIPFVRLYPKKECLRWNNDELIVSILLSLI